MLTFSPIGNRRYTKGSRFKKHHNIEAQKITAAQSFLQRRDEVRENPPVIVSNATDSILRPTLSHPESPMQEQTISAPPSIPTYDQDDSFMDYYEEWMETLITAMKGTAPDDSPTNDLCRNNLQLQDRGCSMLIPTCHNYDSLGLPDAWHCHLFIWALCDCSTKFKPPWRYIIPMPTHCSGDVMHTAELVSLLGSTSKNIDPRAQILIPLGQCELNPHFVLFWVILISLIALFVLPLPKMFFFSKKRKLGLQPPKTKLVSSIHSADEISGLESVAAASNEAS